MRDRVQRNCIIALWEDRPKHTEINQLCETTLIQNPKGDMVTIRDLGHGHVLVASPHPKWVKFCTN
jgi:hypothetical protein